MHVAVSANSDDVLVTEGKTRRAGPEAAIDTQGCDCVHGVVTVYVCGRHPDLVRAAGLSCTAPAHSLRRALVQTLSPGLQNSTCR